ncbi:2-hydroxyisoflavanone dehydratase-like [Pistacia vera]|uniref:2-hydroxyisoflavanone dehydratase-like n=1 Tax=Pistacia vera TaxID=55513 RepID=UPI0012631A16|nr:2-hydroxyisoflavanone dehydratase-like [Pistacia vera]
MASLFLNHFSSALCRRYSFKAAVYVNWSTPITSLSKMASSGSSVSTSSRTHIHNSSVTSGHHPNPIDPNEVAHEFRFFRVYKDGRIEKFRSTEKIPPSDDPVTGVRIKDVEISSQPAVSARIFLPKIRDSTRKFPVLYHVHGGGFCFESAFSPIHSKYLTLLTAEADVITVSVEYGLFPDRPIPACYEDSWAGLQWVAGHVNGNGPESWLNEHADLGRVFIGGESAGGNISHNLAVRIGTLGLPGVNVAGMVLVHPYFGGTDDDQMWLYMCPSNGRLQDPRLKPSAEDLARLGSKRVLIFVAEKDHLNVVGRNYYQELKESGWKGSAEILENEGEDHCFHMENLSNEKAVTLIQRFVSFMKEE